RTRLGPAFATSMKVPSLRSLSKSEPGMRRSRSLATRADTSSSRSTPSAAAMRGAVPKALMSTGIEKPSTFSKRRAWLPSAGPLDTRSVISVISRSRETGALMRRSWPVFSRGATNSRRAAQGPPRLLVVVELHQPAREDRKEEARRHSHRHEVPAHQRRLPGEDPLHAEKRPGGHVSDERAQRHPGVGKHHQERHAHHRS